MSSVRAGTLQKLLVWSWQQKGKWAVGCVSGFCKQRKWFIYFHKGDWNSLHYFASFNKDSLCTDELRRLWIMCEYAEKQTDFCFKGPVCNLTAAGGPCAHSTYHNTKPSAGSTLLTPAGNQSVASKHSHTERREEVLVHSSVIDIRTWWRQRWRAASHRNTQGNQ